MLLHAHSGLRYLVLLVGAAVVLYTLVALMTGRPYDRVTRGLSGAFAGTLHLQVLLGLALLFSGRFYPALTGHIVLMVFAAACAQIPVSVMKRRPPELQGHLPHLVGAAVALALIWLGLNAIGRTLLGTA